MAVTGAIIAGVGTAVTIVEGKKQAKEQGIRQRAIRATEFGKRAAERRAQVRERRIKTARLQVAAEATGVRGSSGELGLESVFSTQFAANTGFGAGLQEARDVIGASQIKTAKSQVRGAIGSSLQSIGFKAFEANDGFKSIFGS